jgi:hypothetical protein
MLLRYSPDQATRVARILLPDILPYDPMRPAAYPGNGRTLTDEVVDVFISTITNAKVTGDGVGPHKDLFADFPYSGHPHKEHSLKSVAHKGALLLQGMRAILKTSGRRVDSYLRINQYLRSIVSISSLWPNHGSEFAGVGKERVREVAGFLANGRISSHREVG